MNLYKCSGGQSKAEVVKTGSTGGWYGTGGWSGTAFSDFELEKGKNYIIVAYCSGSSNIYVDGTRQSGVSVSGGYYIELKATTNHKISVTGSQGGYNNSAYLFGLIIKVV